MIRLIEPVIDLRWGRAKATAFLLCLIFASPMAANALDIGRYSASGTHVCDGSAGRQCVVSGSGYRNCIDAANSLKVQDCCRTQG